MEVPELLAEQCLSDLQVGASVLAGGQLGERDGDGGRRGVIVAAIVHPGDYPTRLLIPGDG